MNRDPGEAAVVRAAVHAVRQGDRDAFARLVELYQRRLFGLALMVTRDPSGAEEVTQDALVRAFVKLDAYDEQRPFYPWISTIAVRLAHNWLLHRARSESFTTEPPDAEGGASPVADPLVELMADEYDRALWRAVAALSSGERAAVILHYRQEMSAAEVASALGVTQGTVKTFLFRARGKLRRTLGALFMDVNRNG